MQDWTWDLSVLYKGFDDPQIEEDFRKLDELIEASDKWNKNHTSPSAHELEENMDIQEALSGLIEKLYSFAGLTLATDASNEDAQKMQDRIQLLFVRMTLINSAFERIIGGINELDALISGSEKLTKLRYPLERAKENAQHKMTPDIEAWVERMSLSGAQAFTNLRDQLDATHMVDFRGESLPLAAVRNMAYDPDASVRKDAYEAEIASYKRIETPMAACLNSIKFEANTRAEATHYDSVLDMTLEQSAMDKETLDAMWGAIKEVLPAFRKYLRKKAELLGHRNGLPFYDLFAPISKGNEKPETYTIEQTRQTLISEMSKFSPDMGAFIDKAFEDRWIDVYPREGKGGGAFCSGLHSMDLSRVLTNFVGSFSDVSTIAHELGHAWHNRCMKGLPYALTDIPMELAETASIFNETLLSNAVRKNASPAKKFAYLENSLMETTQTIVDIYSRYLFESAVIEGRKSHNLSVNELKSLMLDAQEKSYGDGLDPDIRHPYMWACKSHYYSVGFNFYNFPYAFGHLFGLGVFAQYLEKGEAFVPTYNKLLRSCGSGKIADVASSVGIDVHNQDFWRNSLKIVTGEIDEFIRLADA